MHTKYVFFKYQAGRTRSGVQTCSFSTCEFLWNIRRILASCPSRHYQYIIRVTADWVEAVHGLTLQSWHMTSY